MENFESRKLGPEAGESDTEKQIEDEAVILDKNVGEVATQLQEVDLGKLTPEKQQSLLNKGEIIVGSIFGALGAAGVGTFGYEVWNREGFDTPEKALVSLGILLAGFASTMVAKNILKGNTIRKKGIAK